MGVSTKVMRQEFDDQSQCLDRFEVAKSLQVPVEIMVSTRFLLLENARMQKMLGRLREDWLRLCGSDVLVSIDSGHFIQRDAPARVVQVIDEIVERVTRQHSRLD